MSKNTNNNRSAKGKWKMENGKWKICHTENTELKSTEPGKERSSVELSEKDGEGRNDGRRKASETTKMYSSRQYRLSLRRGSVSDEPDLRAGAKPRPREGTGELHQRCQRGRIRGRSRADCIETRRIGLDSDPRLYMYTPSGSRTPNSAVSIREHGCPEFDRMQEGKDVSSIYINNND